MFEANDIDFEAQSTFRREINAQGKSRAFLNDTPVSLSLVKEIGDRLVDIHSQHQTLALTDSGFQIAVVDNMAWHQALLRKYSDLFQEYKQQQLQLQEYIERESKAVADRDYFEFQYHELESANLITGEQETIEQELKVLDHAEEIKSRLFSASQSLSGGENPMISRISEVNTILSQAARFNTAVNELQQRFESCFIEMKDIANELEQIETHVHFDEEQATQFRERLNLLYHLEQKHQVKSIEELIALQQSLSDRLLGIASIASGIEELTSTIGETENKLKELAAEL